MERELDHERRAAAASALRWWADAGVDVLVAEEPRDWLSPKAAVPTAPARQAAAEEALPGQLELFHEFLRTSERLSFASPSAPRVCPAGDPASGLMILADMPSSEDCAAGTLLTGEAGRLFERMLAAIGRDRASIYLAALSCIRSPSGRLTGEPASQCTSLARHHVGLAAPRALLLFGDECAKALLGLPVSRARGRWHELATHSGPIKTLVTYRPSYLLDQPAAKALAWADLQMLARGIET